MEVRIKRVDKELPMPEYKTVGAAAFDIYAREKTTVPAKGWAKIPSNFIIATPKGHALIVSARSSLAKHFPGLFLANGIGLIDSDFCGPNDEILVSMYNFSGENIVIERGFRVAQGRFEKVLQADWIEVDEINFSDRGGFGSTGID